jgi:hypothetical protein
MKRCAAWKLMVVLAVAAGAPGSSLAAERGLPAAPPAAVLRALAGTAVSSIELGKQHGRGITIDSGSGSAITAGTTNANAVINSPIGGIINLDHSIDNNTGITSVLQNFGNNSVMQVSTTINISVH